eukprot:4761747-Pleurochrysis_carterae.AAC.1
MTPRRYESEMGRRSKRDRHAYEGSEMYDTMHPEMCQYEKEERSVSCVASDDPTTVWRMTLQKAREFMWQKGGQRRPSDRSEDADEKHLANWIHYQQ